MKICSSKRSGALCYIDARVVLLHCLLYTPSIIAVAEVDNDDDEEEEGEDGTL